MQAGCLPAGSCVDHSSAAVNCQCCGLCLISALQTHLTFGKEFTEAVEMKQVAQQEAERARFIVEKVPRPSEKLDGGISFLLLLAVNISLACPGDRAGGMMKSLRVAMLTWFSALAYDCWIDEA